MSDALWTLLGTVVGTVVGALLGWGLPEISTRRREKRERAEEVANARAMIRLEAGTNLANLLGPKDKYTAAEPPGVGTAADQAARAVRLAEGMQSPLAWPDEMWHSQLVRVPEALSKEEMQATHLFYVRLGRLSDLQAQMHATTVEKRIAERDIGTGARGGVWGEKGTSVAQTHTLSQKLMALWSEFEITVNNMQAVGNPLQEDPTPPARRRIWPFRRKK